MRYPTELHGSQQLIPVISTRVSAGCVKVGMCVIGLDGTLFHKIVPFLSLWWLTRGCWDRFTFFCLNLATSEASKFQSKSKISVQVVFTTTQAKVCVCAVASGTADR